MAARFRTFCGGGREGGRGVSEREGCKEQRKIVCMALNFNQKFPSPSPHPSLSPYPARIQVEDP